MNSAATTGETSLLFDTSQDSQAGNVAQLVEGLTSIHEALASMPNTT